MEKQVAGGRWQHEGGGACQREVKDSVDWSGGVVPRESPK